MASDSTRLSAPDWARAALTAIAGGGLSAVGIEPLARTLGVTKGSFYAHYRNRDELIVAALAEWERGHGEDGLAEFAAITDPARRLRDLLTAVVHAVRPLAPSVHLSLLGDRNDARVRDVVSRVNRARLDLLTRTYLELGLPPDRAAARARVAYGAILGLSHLAQTDPDTPLSGSDATGDTTGDAASVTVSDAISDAASVTVSLADEAVTVFLPS